MAMEESWLGVRGVSRKKGVSAGQGQGVMEADTWPWQCGTWEQAVS